MKIRSTSDLLDYLDHEMAWRIKEVHVLKMAVYNAKGANVSAHLRAGVAMLYAHWEGFVKNSANAYVAYLAHRGDRNRDLQACFVALGMKTMLASSHESSKSSIAVSTVSYLLTEIDKPAKLPRKDIINTESNLNSVVFTNILGWIGFESTKYSPRFSLIDTALLKARNAIAHGEYFEIDEPRFDSLIVDVLELLRWFKTDIENAVVTQAFLKTLPSEL